MNDQLTPEQLNSMIGMSKITPEQSKQALGQSNSFMSKLINGAEGLLPTAGAIVGGIGGAALGGLAGIETGPGALVTGYAGGVAGSGAGAAAGEALRQKLQGQKLDTGEIAKQGGTFAALDAVAGPLAGLGGKILKGVGEAVSKFVIPTSIKEAGQIQAYKAANPLWKRVIGLGSGNTPVTSASTAFKKGLMGTETGIGIRAKRESGKIWSKIISPALEASENTVKVDMPSFFKEAEQKIVSENPELSRQGSLLNALNALKEDYSSVGEVSLKQLQKFKEGWAEFVPDKAYKGQPIAGAFRDVQNTVAGMARQKIYDTLGPEVKQAYLDYGNLQGLQELGKSAMTGGKMKGGFGSFWSAIKDMAIVPAGTIGGQTLYKIGQGIEMLGPAGIKTAKGLLDSLSGSQDDQTNTGAQ